MDAQTTAPTEKARDRWKDVLNQLGELFPGLADKKMTQALNQLWFDKLGNYPYELVMNKLREAAAESNFFPKPGPIARECHRAVDRQSTAPAANGRSDQLLKQQRDESWRTANLLLADLSAEAMEAHKQTAMCQDWRLRWLDAKPATSKLWRAIIYDRVAKGLEPEEFDAEVKPPAEPQRAGQGPLAADFQSSFGVQPAYADVDI